MIHLTADAIRLIRRLRLEWHESFEEVARISSTINPIDNGNIDDLNGMLDKQLSISKKLKRLENGDDPIIVMLTE